MVGSSYLLQNHFCLVLFTQSKKNQVCFCWLNVWCSAALFSPEKTNWMVEDESAPMKQVVISTDRNSFLNPTLIPCVNIKSNGHSHSSLSLFKQRPMAKLTPVSFSFCYQTDSKMKDPRVEELWTEVSSSSRCCLLLYLLLPARFLWVLSTFKRYIFGRWILCLKNTCCNTWIIDVPPHTRQPWEMVMSFVC